jgi:hypothetical protein
MNNPLSLPPPASDATRGPRRGANRKMRCAAGILMLLLAAACTGGKDVRLGEKDIWPLKIDPSLAGRPGEEIVNVAPTTAVAAVATSPAPVVAVAPPSEAELPAANSIAVAPPAASVADAPPIAQTATPPASPAPAVPPKSPPAAKAAAPAAIPARPATVAAAGEPAHKTDKSATAAKNTEPPLDMAALKTRLRDTDGIGVFTKLSLKNQVDDLMKQFRTRHLGGKDTSVSSLRQPYDMLVLKVLAIVQDSDPPLARAISGSREAIWGVLSDPEKFNSIL